jgi:CubicO group peptidase (beta-lactamase class C family)
VYRIQLPFVGLLLLLAPAERVPANVVDENTVDVVVKKAMVEFQAPGIAVALVRDDKVVYLKGHGVRQLGQDEPVTPDTLFAIGSCTKAFTATALALLVQEGKLQWDDRVQKHLPSFHLSDPLADRAVTIRDLLCHRTGLARHDWLRKRAPWGPEEIVRRIGFLKPHTSFRSTFEYANLPLLTAGQIVAAIDRRPYPECLQRRLFEPLGMTGIATSGVDAEKSADHATPHLKNEAGKVRVIPRYLQQADGAGGLNASARTLTHWLRFQLGQGVFAGKRLLPAAVLKETQTPQMVIRREGALAVSYPDLRTTQASYGLGWYVHDYHGQEVVSHGGSIDGFRARCVLVPRLRVGFVVLTNLGGWSLPEAVSNSLLDLLLDAPPHDWNAHFLAEGRRAGARDALKKQARVANRRSGTKPALELSAYAGIYTEPAYGEARVLLEDGKLKLCWSSFRLPLEHFHFETFDASDKSVHFESEVLFRIGAEGRVEGMRFLDQEFKRIPQRTESRP